MASPDSLNRVMPVSETKVGWPLLVKILIVMLVDWLFFFPIFINLGPLYIKVGETLSYFYLRFSYFTKKV